MQAYFGERAQFNQASSILNSTSQEAWGKMKRCPREVGVRLKEKYGEREGSEKYARW